MRPVAKTILALKWPLRLAGIALAIFLAYFAVNFSSLYARVKLDRSYPALSRYAFERTPDVAIVGSSMSFRMYEGYFSTPLRNISIGGGSAATGLAIVASYRSLPKLILVETNILSRRIEQNLVDAFGDNPSEPYQWFKPIRAVISWVYYYVKYSSEVEKVTRLPLLPPSTYDIRDNVNATIAEFAGKDWDVIMRPQMRELSDLVGELERRGCRVVLFELPVVPELRNNAYFRVAHRLARDAFPEEGRWLQISDKELRWVDSSHFDERSAILVARQFDHFLAGQSSAR
ncbi:hypothetical protein [Bradyrhizobium sp.]|uniref:hypothetical protein n=1 Tax=Bradyrhizobium sp. TaxID=376 RepID=UPI001DFEDA7A|nr:hypothetical protein [Bradyrhizobium sp.]MBI5320778.1 hypothetical protein [Bradyrhizobium sp.]